MARFISALMLRFMALTVALCFSSGLLIHGTATAHGQLSLLLVVLAMVAYLVSLAVVAWVFQYKVPVVLWSHISTLRTVIDQCCSSVADHSHHRLD